MAFTFIAGNSATGTGVTSLSCNLPAGIQVGDLLVIVYAFEGVTSSSGPWIIPNVGQLNPDGIGPAKSWLQACWRAPSGTGSGIEVWTAIWSSGTATIGNFVSSQNVVATIGAWRGEYNPTGLISGGPARLEPTAQVTGGQPPAPAVTVNAGELIIACGADQMGGGGYGAPSGFTSREDVTRAGAGTAESTIADRVATVPGATGPITFPNAAAAGTTLGTTATLVFVPTPAAASAGAVLDAPMPEDLDLPDGYLLTWAAIDPTTGADVAGVVVSNVSIFGTDLRTGTGGGDELVGPFMLVPGPGA
jgi:hypothetical protein